MTREAIDSGFKINIFIRDITKIILLQQEKSDLKYQNAMEANYSHEQMTPINCILSNIKVLLEKNQKNMQNGDKNSADHYKELFMWQKESYELNK